MKTLVTSIVATALLSASALAGELVNVAGASKIALNGYDPVAFFADGKPVNGSPAITAEHKGATYLFATEEHKKMFAQSPEKFAPQFGGYCAYGVAVGHLFPIDINTWQVRSGKLYLNLNPAVLKEFNADFDGNLGKATANWPGLVKTNGN